MSPVSLLKIDDRADASADARKVWRILTHYFASTDSAELLLCLIIMYECFPEQERRLGSRRFVSFILRAWFIHALALFLTLSAWSLLSGQPGVASSGSYPIVFIVLSDYLRMSPGLWTIQVGSARVDENALPVLLALTVSARILLRPSLMS